MTPTSNKEPIHPYIIERIIWLRENLSNCKKLSLIQETRYVKELLELYEIIIFNDETLLTEHLRASVMQKKQDL